ncbi:isoprenylcysteine carboxylmethyltransferase family protein [Streptomyces sp. NPDC004232]|uniref:methyltransferase family protein n=1 Tax=Streptomyces sp. NPDC004232 TaxID=3154454 RepID=UPI001D664108|nr:isoprenylcysteine carboxylmethyltransferase family protein [Streptomyces sp. tea 10]
MALPSDFALLGIVCWIGYEVLLRRREFAAAGTWQADDRDRGSTRLLIVCFVATSVINTVFNSTATAQLPIPVRWFGIAVLAGGLALRAWGMRTLSQYYTRTLRTVDGQRLVQEGPYRLIRHPGYCGSLLVWIGYSLGLGSWAATLIVAALLTTAYLWRISTEERLLTAAFGPAYADYRERTKRLVPYVF